MYATLAVITTTALQLEHAACSARSPGWRVQYSFHNSFQECTFTDVKHISITNFVDMKQ